MKHWNMEKKAACLLSVFFLAGLIPIFLLARYNYPCADDFGYSAYTHIAWQETHSVLSVLRGVWDTVVERWYNWQGTFSSIFLMALQPGIWGEGWYCLVPWIMIGAMGASSFFLLYVIFVRLIHVRRPIFISITMLYLIFAVQCMVDKTQAFFWYNGAAHYMLPHSVLLLLASFVILAVIRRPGAVRAWLLAAACLAAFFVGGSNYITGLIAAVLFAAAIGLCLLCRRKELLPVFVVPFVFFLGAFLLNTLAPGNSVRQEAMLYRPGVVKSILLSFFYCAEYVTETWFNWTYLVYAAALIPFLWEGVKAVGDRFSYPCPLLAAGFSYCLLSATFTPSLFATGIAGGGRIFNIVFLDLLLLIMGNLFYTLGWLRRRFGPGISSGDASLEISSREKTSRGNISQGSCLEGRDTRLYLLCAAGAALFIGAMYAKVDPDFFTSTSAIYSLATGEARQYGEETAARTALLRSQSQEENVTIPILDTRPYLLYFSDISEDPADWKNILMARYYQKESVTGRFND